MRETDVEADEEPPKRAWLARVLWLVPVLIAAIGFVVVLDDDPPPAEGDVPPEQIDVDTVSTATLESVVAAYRGDPEYADELPGITLVLAERHFTEGAYDRAFELYAEIMEAPGTQPEQFAVSLSRVAWIAWLSNGDTAVALDTIDRSLTVDPTNAETIYIKGQILWCGAGDASTAVQLFRAVLDAPDLTDEVRTQVEGDLEAAAAGTACR